jgi:transcriptional regulator of acetoin/glycerol metabolism
MEILAAHRWPGNVRELEAVLAKALVRACTGEIRAGHLDLAGEIRGADASGPSAGLEHAMIVAALAQAQGSRKDAASLIGWSRQKLYRRMRILRLRPAPPAREPG